MEMKKAIKWFEASIRRSIKGFDRFGYSHLEVVLRNQRQEDGAGYLITISFYKGNDIQTFYFPVDSKKVALKLFDISEKMCEKYAKDS